MAFLTRRERIGLLSLLIICALILGALALRKPQLKTSENSDLSELSIISDSSDISENSDSIPIPPKKSKAKRPKTPRETPRDHLREPF